MFSDRLIRLTSLSAREDLSAFVFMPTANLRYFTNLSFHAGKRLTLLLAPTDGSVPCLVLPAMDAPRAERSAALPIHLFPWSDADGPASALVRAVRQVIGTSQHAVFGVESTAMRVMELRALERAGASCHCKIDIKEADTLSASLRIIKDEQELAAMAEAARLVEVALQRTFIHVRSGITERALSAILTREILAAGSEGESFENIVASGPHSADPHHENSDRPLQQGDLIVFDCGAVYQGYASDITRTVALGEPGSQAREIHQLVQNANAVGRAALRSGISCEDVDHAVRSCIHAGGYGDRFPHRTGHGLGLELNPCHEAPDLVQGNRSLLASGTVVTIEPGVYVPGIGGVRIEDDMVVTSAGSRSLTSLPRELVVL